MVFIYVRLVCLVFVFLYVLCFRFCVMGLKRLFCLCLVWLCGLVGGMFVCVVRGSVLLSRSLMRMINTE